MPVVNDGAASHIKEILAQTAIASPSSEPSPHMSQALFNGTTLA
jgi:hypothetical protein